MTIKMHWLKNTSFRIKKKKEKNLTFFNLKIILSLCIILSLYMHNSKFTFIPIKILRFLEIQTQFFINFILTFLQIFLFYFWYVRIKQHICTVSSIYFWRS